MEPQSSCNLHSGCHSSNDNNMNEVPCRNGPEQCEMPCCLNGICVTGMCHQSFPLFPCKRLFFALFYSPPLGECGAADAAPLPVTYHPCDSACLRDGAHGKRMTGKVGSSPPEPDLTGRGGSTVAPERDDIHFMPISPQKCNTVLQSVSCDCSEDSVEQHGHQREEQHLQRQTQQVSGGTCGGGGCCSNLDLVADITRGHLTLFLGDAVELVQVNQFFANVKGVLEHSD